MKHVKTVLAIAFALTSGVTLVNCADTKGDDLASGEAALTDAEIAACQGPKKQAVCHIPPGNPANAHAICISVNAVDKHVEKHGDELATPEVCDDGIDNDCDGDTDCEDPSCDCDDISECDEEPCDDDNMPPAGS